MPTKLYESTNGIMKILDTIVKTKGQNWAVQVLNNDGKPVLTPQEQQKFTEAFQPYVESIVDFFGQSTEMDGGVYIPNPSEMSGMSSNFLKTKIAEVTHQGQDSSDPTKMPGIDDIYNKIVNRVGNINSTVNDYASKYGILKLEKEHDLEPDIRLFPQPAALAISEGVFGLSTAAGFPILPNITLNVLSKVKVPFRMIVSIIYLILDVTRIAVGITGPSIGRKIMSILLSILELLRGDWKKAVLSLIGYYGMMPLLIGELLKVCLSLFRTLAPQIQHSIIFGSLDAAKSLIVGILLAIFQVTAPEEVRLPLIGVLEKIAQRKAEMDGTLEDIGLSARPDYLAPTWNDLNNIQAVMSDEAYICSCEFQNLVKAVDSSAIIRIVFEILRIPVNKDMIEYKCGKEPCKDFVTTIVKESKDNKEQEEKIKEPFSATNLEMPININPKTSITAPIDEPEVEQVKPEETIKQEEVKPEETIKQEEQTNSEKPLNTTTKGGRILHSRKNFKKIHA
jgi:hypothetical protein